MAAQILGSLRSETTETPARFEPMPSKKHAERMPHVTFGTHKKQCFGPVPKHPNASKIRAQKHAERMPHVTFGRRGVLTMAAQRIVSLRSEKTETPAGSRPEEQFLHQKGCQERGFRTMATQIFVSLRSEKTETPARFEPMPSKKHAERMLHVTFGTHKISVVWGIFVQELQAYEMPGVAAYLEKDYIGKRAL